MVSEQTSAQTTYGECLRNYASALKRRDMFDGLAGMALNAMERAEEVAADVAALRALLERSETLYNNALATINSRLTALERTAAERPPAHEPGEDDGENIGCTTCGHEFGLHGSWLSPCKVAGCACDCYREDDAAPAAPVADGREVVDANARFAIARNVIDAIDEQGIRRGLTEFQVEQISLRTISVMESMGYRIAKVPS